MILVGISFIACVASFYLLIYGVPVYILGALLVFLSRTKLKTKLFSTLIPLVLYLPSTYVFLLIYNYTPPKIFLIPSDYSGPLRIVYEEKCGVKPVKSNGRQVLKFPETGVLILNVDFDGGVNNKYYLVDSKGNKNEVPQTLDYKDSVRNKPAVLVAGSGTMGAAIYANSQRREPDIKFSDFYVFNGDTTDLENYHWSQQFDSLTTAVVNSCRQSKKTY